MAGRTYHPGNARSGDARYSDWRIVRRMALQARPYWGKITVIFFLSLASAPLSLLTPLPLKIVIDNVVNAHPLPKMIRGLVPESIVHSPSGMLMLAIGLLIGVKLLTYLTSMASALVEAS
ncbi:MAG TPA: hypothetical protein VHC72_17835, partial [Bryobacteraceae bacterium]|nr:hypothetical protein [Bryobacteraceae bacterium]